MIERAYPESVEVNRVETTASRQKNNLHRSPARPIVKWAGGKGQLLPELLKRMPPSFGRYYEPFAGGAALFFRLSPHLQSGQAYLNDLNAELIQLYQIVKEEVHTLIQLLRQHAQNYRHNPEAYYYQVRALQPAELSPAERAARFIFLNKTCYNGLYRVNRSGQFNVPFGRYKNPTILNTEGLLAASLALQKATLTQADFEEAVQDARAGDFVYFDPPYHPVSRTANFTSYTDVPFDEAQQVRLARLYRQLHERGCYVMLSNSDTPLVHELYQDFDIHVVPANRAINSNARRRKGITEVIVCNFSFHGH